MTTVEDIFDNPECMCCSQMDVCTIPCGVTIRITKDMIARSNCNGGFVDAFERDIP